MYPHLFEKDFSSVLYYDTLLAGCQYVHLREFVHDHKYTVTTMFGGREAKQIVHGDVFPRLVGSRQRSVQALLLDGWFGYGIGNARSYIFSNIPSEFWPIKARL